jgi:hypothetical protein
MMAGRTMKVRVPVATLIESAEAKRSEIIEQWEADREKVHTDREKWISNAIAALDAVREALRRGEMPDDVATSTWGRRHGSASSYFIVGVDAKQPDSPTHQPPVDAIDRDLGLLRASTDDTLLVGTDDNFARYLR